MTGRRMVLIFAVVLSMTAAPVFAGQKDGKTETPPRKQADCEKQKKNEDKVRDKDVAAELEMLKMMDMLEHIELLSDMDVLDGGETK